MNDIKQGRLRRAWNAVCRFAEALDYNPVEEMADRLERLEREIAALKDTRRG